MIPAQTADETGRNAAQVAVCTDPRLAKLRKATAAELARLPDTQGMSEGLYRDGLIEQTTRLQAKLAAIDVAAASEDSEEREWLILEIVEGREVGSTKAANEPEPYVPPVSNWTACGREGPLPTAVCKYPGSMSAALLSPGSDGKTRHYGAKAPIYENGQWVNRDGPTIVGESKPRAPKAKTAPAPAPVVCACPHCGKLATDPIAPDPIAPAPKLIRRAARVIVATSASDLRPALRSRGIQVVTIARDLHLSPNHVAAVVAGKRRAAVVEAHVASLLGGVN